MVRSHVCVGERVWASFSANLTKRSVTMVSGHEFPVNPDPPPTIGDAPVLALDMPAANGCVHVIGKVLGNLGVVTEFRRPPPKRAGN